MATLRVGLICLAAMGVSCVGAWAVMERARIEEHGRTQRAVIEWQTRWNMFATEHQELLKKRRA